MRTDPRSAAEAFLSGHPMLGHLPAAGRIDALARAIDNYRGAGSDEGPPSTDAVVAAADALFPPPTSRATVRFDESLVRIERAFAVFAGEANER